MATKKHCDLCDRSYEPKGRTIMVSHPESKFRKAIDLCAECCDVLGLTITNQSPRNDLLDLLKDFFKMRTT